MLDPVTCAYNCLINATKVKENTAIVLGLFSLFPWILQGSSSVSVVLISSTSKEHEIARSETIKCYELNIFNILGTRLWILIHLVHKLALGMKLQSKNSFRLRRLA